jgi:hypothetical protein
MYGIQDKINQILRGAETIHRNSMTTEQTSEVARLRELLNRAIEIADNYEIAGLPRDGFMLHWKVNKHEFSMLKEKTRLGPAPEEPVTGLCLICHEKQTTCSSGLCEECKEPEEPVSIPTDLNQQNKENTVSLNDWRELLRHEKVQKGDEEWWHKELGWRPATSSIGEKAGETLYLTRTRRPLPKQEEMPLEKMMQCFLGDYPDAGKAIYDAIYNLRDEIQKLKEIK